MGKTFHIQTKRFQEPMIRFTPARDHNDYPLIREARSEEPFWSPSLVFFVLLICGICLLALAWVGL